MDFNKAGENGVAAISTAPYTNCTLIETDNHPSISTAFLQVESLLEHKKNKS